MSFIDFQISATSFLAFQANASRQIPLCAPPFSFGGPQLVVDHIEFGGGSLRNFGSATYQLLYVDHGELLPAPNIVDGLLPQCILDIVIYLAELSDVLAHPNGSPATVIPFGVTAVLNLDYFVLDNQCRFHAPFDHAEMKPCPPLPPGWNCSLIQEAIEKFLPLAVPSPAVPFDFATVFAGKVSVVNAGVAIDTQRQYVTFRAQFGTVSSDVDLAWKPFFNGNIPDERQGADWALHVGKGELELSVSVSIEDALSKAKKFHLVTGVASTYSNTGGKVLIVSHFGGNVDLPDPLTTSYIEADVRTELSVATPNTLTLDISTPDPKSYANQILGAFGPVLREFLLPFIAFQRGLEGTAAAAAKFSPPLPTCKQIAPEHLRCTQSYPSVTAGGFDLDFTKLAALDDGISFTGNISGGPAPAQLQITSSPFNWVPPSFSCGSAGVELVAAFQNSPQDFALAATSVLVDDLGDDPIFLCGFNVVNDPLNAYPQNRFSATGTVAPLQILIRLSQASEDFRLNPYPCDLLISTTAGVRLVRIPPPAQLTQAIIDKLVARLIVELGNCEKLVVPWSRYNPLWSVDPQFGRNVEHLWNIEITGLPPGETVIVIDSKNQEIMKAVATSERPLRLGGLLPPAGENELTLIRPAQEGATEARRAQPPSENIAVKQQLVLEGVSIPLLDTCDRVTPARFRSRGSVIVVGSNGVSVFDLSNPYRPVLAASWYQLGLRGTLNFATELLAFGQDGFTRLSAEQKNESVGCRPIMDAAAGARCIYAVTYEGLEIFSSGLCRQRTIPMDGGLTLARMGEILYVGGRFGLTVYDLAEPLEPRPIASSRNFAVTRLIVPPDLGPDSIAGVLADGSVRLFHLAKEEIREWANYVQAPWFVDCVRVGNALVRMGSKRMNLDVSVLGEQRIS